ncbi:MAG: glycosyltransferase family 1 protein [Candidatus Saccharibacteria bacterium]|nr:glycosyltransferase family 1 protein [Candidatus Saccharibacteria bacterium]
MNILIDASPLYAGPLTGIGYYTESLVEGLAKVKSVDTTGFAFNLLGKKPSSALLKIQEQKMLPGKLMSYPRYANIELPLEMFFSTKGYDVILGTNYLLPPNIRNIPSIATIHDLCFYDHPEWVQSKNAHILKKLLPKTIERSSGIITISEFSLSRIRDVYNYTGPALVVDIPPKISMATPKKPSNISLVSKKYFLFIGTIEPRKNIGRMLDAFERLSPNLQSEYPIVLAGKPGWDSEVLDRLTNANNPNIHYLDYISENERTWLYQNATATIIPSLYEGFGMMTLESLALGAPAITSDIPPQREILGKHGQYFDPLNIDELTGLLLKFTDPKHQQSALKAQLSVLHNYSWDKVIEKTLAFINQITS